MKLDRSWVRSKLLWVIGVGSSLVLISGCQQWSLRESTAGLFGPRAEMDDWEPPMDVVRLPREDIDGEEVTRDKPAKKGMNRWWSNSKNGPPPPRVVLPKDREAKKNSAEAIEQKSSVDRSAAEEVQSNDIKKPTVMGYGTNPNGNPGMSVTPSTGSPSATEAKSPSAAVQPTQVPVASAPASSGESATTRVPTGAAPSVAPVVDTGVRDIDIEGALRSLPPEYRDVVRQSIEALQVQGPREPAAQVPALAAALSPSETLPVQGVSSASAAPSTVLPPPALPSGSVARQSETVGGTEASTSAGGVVSGIQSVASQGGGDVTTTPVKTADFATHSSGANSIATNTKPDQPITIRLGGERSGDSQVVTSSHVDRAQVPQTSPAGKQDALSQLPSSLASTATTWRHQASLAVEALERELENAPSADPALRVSQELTLRMLYVAQRRLDDALRPIEDLSVREQEFIQHEMQALYAASNPDANPSRARHWSQVMVSQRQATGHLSAISNLEVRGLAFCDEVSGYGMLERCKKNLFAPDQDVLLYCEIDNVTAERVKAGYETQLQGSYEILDSQKRRLTEQLLPMEPELCQNHRRDYYIVYRIFMPAQIQPGRHELALTIEDMKGHKFGHATVEFEIRKP